MMKQWRKILILFIALIAVVVFAQSGQHGQFAKLFQEMRPDAPAMED